MAPIQCIGYITKTLKEAPMNKPLENAPSKNKGKKSGKGRGDAGTPKQKP